MINHRKIRDISTTLKTKKIKKERNILSNQQEIGKQ